MEINNLEDLLLFCFLFYGLCTYPIFLCSLSNITKTNHAACSKVLNEIKKYLKRQHANDKNSTSFILYHQRRQQQQRRQQHHRLFYHNFTEFMQ